MTEHLARCGLEKADSHEADSFSIISGGQVVFQNTGGWLDSVRTVLRYGLWSLSRLEYLIANLLNNFALIYPALDQGQGFETVADILEEMSPVSKSGELSHEMIKLTKLSIEEKLLELGVSHELIGELATIATKVNYNQFTDGLHGFVGSVSLAGIQGGLWRVKGGNKLIPRCLLEQSRAKLMLSTKIESVEADQAGSGRYNVTYYSTPDSAVRSSDFDKVVVAFPLTADKSELRLKGLAFPGRYQRTLAYIVEGTLAQLSGNDAETTNYFYIDQAVPISSISLLTPVDFEAGESAPPGVYKIFSRIELSRTDLAEYFTEIRHFEVVDWLAYPDYSTYPGLGPMRLQENLYYVNSIEWAASAMEMSALAAKNVANLIAGQSVGDGTMPSEKKTEL